MAFFDRRDLLPLALLDDDWISPYDFISPRSVLQSTLHRNYPRAWRHTLGSQSGISNVVNNKDEFQVNLDVQQFKPDEINVKVVDNFITIEGKHEERKDEHGYISRQFQRRYLIPNDVDPKAVASTLSSDGVLTVKAPKSNPLPAAERVITITHTNAPAIKPGKQKEDHKIEQ